MAAVSRSIHRHHLHTSWDNSLLPVHRVESGAVVEFDCIDASNGQIVAKTTVEDMANVDLANMNPLFGPVYIDTAEPGNVLEVEILALETGPYAWSAIFPGFGLLTEYMGDERAVMHWRVAKGYATTTIHDKELKVPVRPFCGEMGVARREPGPHSTIPPYFTGGNIDTKYLTEGAKLMLPIEVVGALFSIGDGHCTQGDGEVGGTAIETSMKAKVRLTVRKVSSLQLPASQPQYITPPTDKVPEIEQQGYFSTMGIDPDFLQAATLATLHMVEHLTANYSITRAQALMLCSAVGDLQALQVVDMPNYSFGFRMPFYILEQLG